jgi:hypothetical protein
MQIENLLNENIKSKNYTDYAYSYNLLQNPSPYYKSHMLLHLLSSNNKKEYYKLLQTVSVEDSESQDIRFIIELDLLINTCNIKKIKDLLISSLPEEVKYFIKKIVDNLKEDSVTECKRYDKKSEVYYEEVIKDSMFIVNK